MSNNPLFNPLLDPPEQADFGRGFTLCILKFLEHTHQHDDMLGMPSIGPISNVQLWFNGSSDHFYELQIPPGWETKATEESKIASGIRKIATEALVIGHGFKGVRYDMTDYDKAVHGCVKVLVELDKLYDQSFFWNLAGVIINSFKYKDDEEQWRKAVAVEYLSFLRHGPETSPEVRLLTEELIDLVVKKRNRTEINQKVFEIAVAFDIEVGITDANIGAH